MPNEKRFCLYFALPGEERAPMISVSSTRNGRKRFETYHPSAASFRRVASLATSSHVVAVHLSGYMFTVKKEE